MLQTNTGCTAATAVSSRTIYRVWVYWYLPSILLLLPVLLSFTCVWYRYYSVLCCTVLLYRTPPQQYVRYFTYYCLLYILILVWYVIHV